MNDTNYIKSPLNYTGGKHKLLSHIVPTFKPNIKTFIDLFAGGFNVGVNVDADKIICNDHMHFLKELYEYFQATETALLIDQIKDIISYYGLTDSNKDGYLKLRGDYNETKNILDLFVLTCYSFNHQIRFNNKHEFNTPFGKNRSCYNNKIENNLRVFCKALKEKHILFTSLDFTMFDYSTLKQGVTVYCDPPYLITTGSYNDGKRGFKDWSIKEEVELLDTLDMLNRRGISFVLSNVFYHKGMSNDILIDWSKKYYTNYINKSYSNCSYHFKDRKTKTVEVLITNYEREVVQWEQASML